VISAFPFQVTRKHNDDCKRLLRLMGVPVVEVSLLLLSICQLSCFSLLFYTDQLLPFIDVFFQCQGGSVEY